MGLIESKSFHVGVRVQAQGSNGCLWSRHEATLYDTGEDVSLWIHRQDKNESTAITKAISTARFHLRTIRHPNIMKFRSEYISSNVTTYLITEPVEPLVEVVKNIDIHELTIGLYQIVRALTFLHDQCHVAHNNLHIGSVFVSTIDGQWKLGGFEFIGIYTKNELAGTRHLRHAESITPEEDNASSESKVPVYFSDDDTALNKASFARDAWALSRLIENIVNSVTSAGEDNLGRARSFTAHLKNTLGLKSVADRCMVGSVLDSSYFKEDIVLSVRLFLGRITILSYDEKFNFFSSLSSRILNAKFSNKVMSKHLLPPLLSSHMLSEPLAFSFLNNLLTPGSDNENSFCKGVTPLLSRTEFVRVIIPELIILFRKRDLAVRLTLLRHLKCFVCVLDPVILAETIIPEILVGLDDKSDKLAAASLCALSVLIEYAMHIPVGDAPSLSVFIRRKCGSVITDIWVTLEEDQKLNLLEMLSNMWRDVLLPLDNSAVADVGFLFSTPLRDMSPTIRRHTLNLLTNCDETNNATTRHIASKILLPLICPLLSDDDAEIVDAAAQEVNRLIHVARYGSSSDTVLPHNSISQIKSCRKALFRDHIPRPSLSHSSTSLQLQHRNDNKVDISCDKTERKVMHEAKVRERRELNEQRRREREESRRMKKESLGLGSKKIVIDEIVVSDDQEMLDSTSGLKMNGDEYVHRDRVALSTTDNLELEEDDSDDAWDSIGESNHADENVWNAPFIDDTLPAPETSVNEMKSSTTSDGRSETSSKKVPVLCPSKMEITAEDDFFSDMVPDFVAPILVDPLILKTAVNAENVDPVSCSPVSSVQKLSVAAVTALIDNGDDFSDGDGWGSDNSGW